METKYLKYTLEGEQSMEDAQRALGDDVAQQGLVVRVDNIGGQTHFYIAAQDTDTSAAISGKKMVIPDGVKVEEVSVNDVTKCSDL